jgi:hypothetical protein
MEAVITMILLSILISSLFRLNSNRMLTLQTINDNTIALYAVESAKNRALLQLEDPAFEKKLPAVFPEERWLIRSFANGAGIKITVQKAMIKNPRVYHAEVVLNEK